MGGAMRWGRAWILILGLMVGLPQVGAHEIEQVFVRVTLERETWRGQAELDALMVLEIVAGGESEEDGTNAWFSALGEAEARKFFGQVEDYWRERFVLKVGGVICPFELVLPDSVLLQRDVKGSPEEGMLINMTFAGSYPGGGGPVELSWNDAEGPYLVVGLRLAEEGGGTSMIPVEDGATVRLAERESGGEDGAEVVRTVEGPSFWLWIKYGFTHILPGGMDHILFVLGLFLLVPKWKPLLAQSAAFTVAHSLSLGLVVLGVFSVPSGIVEPLISLSIVYVALENLWVKELKPGRVALVFGLGLVHGLGFASVLQGLEIPDGEVFRPLFGFNMGVELGQVAVLGLAFLATFWCLGKEAIWARVRWVGSFLIAGQGLYWTVERIVS